MPAPKRDALKAQIGKTADRPEISTATAHNGLLSDLKAVTVRLDPNDKRRLAAHFRREYDMGLSTGMRMVLKNYMRDNRI